MPSNNKRYLVGVITVLVLVFGCIAVYFSGHLNVMLGTAISDNVKQLVKTVEQNKPASAPRDEALQELVDLTAYALTQEQAVAGFGYLSTVLDDKEIDKYACPAIRNSLLSKLESTRQTALNILSSHPRCVTRCTNEVMFIITNSGNSLTRDKAQSLLDQYAF